MAGTLRTRSALDTLFADNASGDISAQDLRDFLWSTPILRGRVNSALTTGDLTATVNYHHVLTVSGMTAERSLVLPSGTDEGDIISFALETDAPSTIGYELSIKGDTGVTISFLGTDATAATNDEFRYFMKGEGALFRWDDTDSKWLLTKDNDGRIPSGCRLDATGASAQSISTGTWTTVTNITNNVWDMGNLGDTVNERIYPRRDGLYTIGIGVYFQDPGDGTSTVNRGACVNSSAATAAITQKEFTDSEQGGATVSQSFNWDISADVYGYLRCKQQSGGNLDLLAASGTYLEFVEQL